MLVALIIGFLFGFIGSIPVAGPISVLIFARSIENRFRAAFLLGMGSVVAETLYAFFAFWGFAKLLDEYSWIAPISGAAAAIILLALGYVFLKGQKETELNADSEDKNRTENRPWASFMLGFSISGFNPTLLATWAGAAGALSASGLVRFEESLAWPFGLGAGLGIGCWYLILIRIIRHYKGRFQATTLNNVLRFFGFFLIAVGLWFGVRFVVYLASL